MSTASNTHTRYTDPSRLDGRAGFLGGLGFAFCAALALPVLALALARPFGPSHGLPFALLLIAVAFAGFGAPSARAGAKGALLVALGGAGSMLCARLFGCDLVTSVALGCAALIGTLRSGVYYAMPGLRGGIAEGLLQGGGLALAALLGGTSPLGQAAGLWGYLLVQSVFGLIPGTRKRNATTAPGDDLAGAMQRLERLLDA